MPVEEGKPSAASALFYRLLLEFAQNKPDTFYLILKKAEIAGSLPADAVPDRSELGSPEKIALLLRNYPGLSQAIVQDPAWRSFAVAHVPSPTAASRAPSATSSSPITGSDHFSSHRGGLSSRAPAMVSATPGRKCFVATAAFGSPLAPEVDALRAWREDRLVASGPGRALIRAYEAVGPALARVIESSDVRRRASRLLLAPLIRLARFDRRTVRAGRAGREGHVPGGGDSCL